jgi:hypothetical protein
MKLPEAWFSPDFSSESAINYEENLCEKDFESYYG